MVKKIEKILEDLKELKDYLIDSYLYMEDSGNNLIKSIENTIEELENNL